MGRRKKWKEIRSNAEENKEEEKTLRTITDKWNPTALVQQCVSNTCMSHEILRDTFTDGNVWGVENASNVRKMNAATRSALHWGGNLVWKCSYYL